MGARRGRRAAGRARARDRVVARGVDRGAGDLAGVLAGRPGGTGRVAPPAPAARSRLHAGAHLVGARAARGSRDPAAVPPRRPHPRAPRTRPSASAPPTSSSRTRSTSGRGGCARPSRTGRRPPCAGRVRNRGSCGSSSTTGPSWRPRSRSSTARASGTCTSSPSSGRTAGRDWPRRCSRDAFGRAREHGATRSELSTDSRTGALDLYLKVGMEVTQVWTHLVTDLPR